MQNLSKSETSLAIAAILAVAPSGGGSSLYTLARKIADDANIAIGDIDPEFIYMLQATAAAEIR